MKKQFKSESKRLLDLMINSIYTNKEIFLRELISNASDAIDKRYFLEASGGKTGMSRDDYEIRITPDKDGRTLTISDNGIGMSADEMENNLGTIAESGSFKFKSENKDKEDDTDIIGQFGVGFYSAFMVSGKIEVMSRRVDSEKAYLWVSTGSDGYTIEEADRPEAGTTITLYLREDTDDDKYSDFLQEFRIKSLVRKYSDYIRYPIMMNCTKTREVEATEEQKKDKDYKPEYETYQEDEKLNSMVPIWKRKKSEIKDEEYNEFYKSKFGDWQDPLKVIHTNVEGVLSYNALLFIPSQVPFNFYTKDFKRGLQLYSSGVMIMDSCEDLLPSYLSFVKGLVDSQDVSLNISREMLQQDRQVKAIAQRIEKKVLQELKDMEEKDRENYKKLWTNFGMQLKYGIYDGFGVNKDKLQDLVMFKSSTTDDYATFKEYVDRMPEDQKYIYYASGESDEKIKKTPQMDPFKEKGYEVLFCTDDIDEFALRMMNEYDGKEFKNITDKDLGFSESEDEKKAAEEKNEANKNVLGAVKEVLQDKVSSVIISNRLKDHPVCFATGDGLSLEMEKVLKAQAAMMGSDEGSALKADKILELNSDHQFFQALKNAVEKDDKDKIRDYSLFLYDQALLIEGMPIDDPVDFSNRVCSLMK